MRKSKLDSQLEHARILNMELIKLINNLHHQIHQQSKSELEQVKSLNPSMVKPFRLTYLASLSTLNLNHRLSDLLFDVD